MSRLTVDRCNGLRCSLTKNALPVGFIRARSFSHALMARSSSPRSGCVVDNPPFNRATCSTRLSVSTWSSFIRQASDTRKPCRNIRSNRQRSRASFLLPLVASISRSTSRPVRCFRSLISPAPGQCSPPSRPRAGPPVFPLFACSSFCREFTLSDAPETRINRAGDFSTMNKRDHFCINVSPGRAGAERCLQSSARAGGLLCTQSPTRSVVADEVNGGLLATKLLLEKGHRRIAMINADQKYPAAAGRFRGSGRRLRIWVPVKPELMRPGGPWQDVGCGMPWRFYNRSKSLPQSSAPATGSRWVCMMP